MMAGNLDREIKLRQRVETRNSAGEVVVSFTDIATSDAARFGEGDRADRAEVGEAGRPANRAPTREPPRGLPLSYFFSAMARWMRDHAG